MRRWNWCCNRPRRWARPGRRGWSDSTRDRHRPPGVGRCLLALQRRFWESSFWALKQGWLLRSTVCRWSMIIPSVNLMAASLKTCEAPVEGDTSCRWRKAQCVGEAGGVAIEDLSSATTGLRGRSRFDIDALRYRSICWPLDVDGAAVSWARGFEFEGPSSAGVGFRGRSRFRRRWISISISIRFRFRFRSRRLRRRTAQLRGFSVPGRWAAWRHATTACLRPPRRRRPVSSKACHRRHRCWPAWPAVPVPRCPGPFASGASGRRP